MTATRATAVPDLRFENQVAVVTGAAAIRAWGGRHPIGRVIEADEVAAAIAFLCSADASAITGVCLPVDGGLLARLAV